MKNIVVSCLTTIWNERYTTTFDTNTNNNIKIGFKKLFNLKLIRTWKVVSWLEMTNLKMLMKINVDESV